MTIRTKIVGAALMAALLVPVLGGVAVSRVQRIKHDTSTVQDVAVPGALIAKDIDLLQRQQQEAVLSYFAGGTAADRQRYLDLVAAMDQRLADLRTVTSAGPAADGASPTDLVQQITEQRATFDAAANELLAAREQIEQNVENVRVNAEAIVLELTVLRNRFAPAPGAPASSSQPAPLRVQVSQLLFGVEGMMSDVGFEAALSSGYAITRDPRLRQRFEDASGAFKDFLATAKSASGPEDRPTIDRVETKFQSEFEPSARRLMQTADAAATSRATFGSASVAMADRLEAIVTSRSEMLVRAQQDARGAVQSSIRILILVTITAVVVAGAGGVWFAHTITRPIRVLRDEANRISSGETSAGAVKLSAADEIGDLARAFHRMLVSIRLLMVEKEPGEEIHRNIA
jgi:HAMP domain-containing protein